MSRPAAVALLGLIVVAATPSVVEAISFSRPASVPSSSSNTISRRGLIISNSGSRNTGLWGCIPRGGADSGSYTSQLESVKSKVLQSASTTIDSLRRQIVDEGQTVEDFGSLADQICNQALEDFAMAAPAAPDANTAAAYDRTLQQIEAAVDAPLQVLYLKLLGYLREAALQTYRATGKDNYESMLQADAAFCRAAEAATRADAAGGGWDYTQERAFLQAVLSLSADAASQSQQVQLQAAQQQQTAMQFLQSQQQMIQQLQMQLYGQSSPWNVGVAYRIPDTNFNLQGSYQQGRANVQLSCVPDEYAPFLGPNGFTNGVGPGNLGLSLNLSL